MVIAVDVAKYVTEQVGRVSCMKLQKLVYYSHAWNLVATAGEPLVSEPIEAFAHGPVVRPLWESHRGRTSVSSSDLPEGDSSRLTTQQREVIAAVVARYGTMSAWQLRTLSHVEAPWQHARATGSDISDESMFVFYGQQSIEQDTVSLPSWCAVLVSQETYDEMMHDVEVPDDPSELVRAIQEARAALA